MVLYQDGFIKLNYDATNDMLCAECPDIQEFILLRVHQAFNHIVATLGVYGIKNLLIDFSNTVIDVSDEDYKIVISQFAQDLMATRLRKLARIVSKDMAREDEIKSYIKEIQEEIQPVFEIQNFASRAAAINWLQEDQSSITKNFLTDF